VGGTSDSRGERGGLLLAHDDDDDDHEHGYYVRPASRTSRSSSFASFAPVRSRSPARAHQD
jgi:hypothetical protein